MSNKGKAMDATGFDKEEMNEHSDTPNAAKKAQERRDFRNEGRIEGGKPLKTTESGTGAQE